VATTGDGGAGAVRVSGAPSGGVRGAGAAADDVGSVIDFLSGAGFGRCVSIATGRDLGSDEPTRRPLPQPELRETITICVVFLHAPDVCVLTAVMGNARPEGPTSGRFDGCDGRRTPEELAAATAQSVWYRRTGYQTCGQGGRHGLFEQSDRRQVLLIRGPLKIIELGRDLPDRAVVMRDLD
jgi:hypothetical protein